MAIIYFKDYTGTINDEYKAVLDTIVKRVNARGLFSPEPVPDNIINSINSKIGNYLTNGIKLHLVTDENKITKLARLTAEGLRAAYHRSTFRREMSRWMHSSLTTKKDGLPGYALRMPLLASFILPTLVKWFDLGILLSKLNYRSFSSAPLVVAITASNDNPNTWLDVGRLGERLMLEFNNLGWQTSIFVAAVEMGNFYQRVQKIINTDQIPQFLFVIGKIDKLHKPTPRHKLPRKLIS